MAKDKVVAVYSVRITLRQSHDVDIKPLTLDDLNKVAEGAVSNVVAKQNNGTNQADFSVNAESERVDI